MLAQLSTIKKRLSIDLFDTTDDVLITNILNLVCARFSGKPRTHGNVVGRGTNGDWRITNADEPSPARAAGCIERTGGSGNARGARACSSPRARTVHPHISAKSLPSPSAIVG